MKGRQSKFKFLKNCILYSGIFSITILYSTDVPVEAVVSPTNETSQVTESESGQARYPAIVASVGPLNPLNPEEPVEPIDSVDREKKPNEGIESESSKIEMIHPESELEGIPDGSKAIRITNTDDFNGNNEEQNKNLKPDTLNGNLALPAETSPSGGGNKTTEMAYIEEVFAELSGVVFFGVKQR